MSRRRRSRRELSPAEQLLNSLDRNAPLVLRRRADDPWFQTEEAWRETWGIA